MLHIQLEYSCRCKHDEGIIACVFFYMNALPIRTHRSPNSNVYCTPNNNPGGSPAWRLDMVHWVLKTINGLGQGLSLGFETASQAVVMVDRLMEKLPPMDSVGPNITTGFQHISIYIPEAMIVKMPG